MVWTCKIGSLGQLDIPGGADLPMRQAIKQAFYDLTGKDADICFSGWNGDLTEIEEKMLVEDAERMKEWRERFGR